MEPHEIIMEPGLSNPPASSQVKSPAVAKPFARLGWIWPVLLAAVVLVGGYFRFTAVNWDQNQHLHPDERFLTMVLSSIEPVDSISEYFNTHTSSLNPHNRGYGFYVYGTLPLFLVRYVGEWLGESDYNQIFLVGSQMSASFDLGTVILVFLIAARLFRDRRLALLASAFAALSVLPIQLSHYFTVDTFSNFFGMLAFYCAARLLPENFSTRLPAVSPAGEMDDSVQLSLRDQMRSWLTSDWRSAGPYLLFGAALGLAMASKINAFFLVVLLPLVVIVRLSVLPRADRLHWAGIYLRHLAAAGLVSFLVFRIFQPYAFSGPGFFNISPNKLWVENMTSLAAQSAGDDDSPPALQWSRRPIWFAFQNMTLWGLGLPLGLLAWAGFVWMGWRILKDRSPQMLLIWSWTGFYFAYQSLSWTRSMRYQMLVYPTLAIIAAWAVFALWRKAEQREVRHPGWLRIGALLLGISVLSLTFAWAFAFTRIYTRPVTRVEASRWIYQNVPGPINLHIETATGWANQPLAFRSGYDLRSEDSPLILAFRPNQSGELTSVTFEHLASAGMDQQTQVLEVGIRTTPDGASLAAAQLFLSFIIEGDPRGNAYSLLFDQPVLLDPQGIYYLIVDLHGEQNSLLLSGSILLSINGEGGIMRQALPEPVDALRSGGQYQLPFSPAATGVVRTVFLEHVVDWENRPEQKTLRLSLVDPDAEEVLAVGTVQSAFSGQNQHRGERYTFSLSTPVELSPRRTYAVRLEQIDGPGQLAVYGSKQTKETPWDDALPLGLDGYNPYDYLYGVYRSDLDFEMYWDDNADKLARFLSILDQADYIFISSNRQWGTTVRIPERYPLTSEYYRRLLGCPAEKEIIWCYSTAQTGMFHGDLGFELAAVFQSNPNLGRLQFNTQFAEEAFTVYDHPKVLIFKKTDAYQYETVRSILGEVDLSGVVHLTPRKAGGRSGNLLLPADRLEQQRAGGTWSELFDTNALINRYPALAAAVWYLVVSLLGLVVYPFTRLALRSLPDRGYPLMRAWWVCWCWRIRSGFWGRIRFHLPRLPSRWCSWVWRDNLASWLIASGRNCRTIALRVEIYPAGRSSGAIFLCPLLAGAHGQPDLWHPWKGGEKPMDFSYFNAVLKSTSFPPYDPWFAGGYINYYYYGYVLVGTPVKWLGIVPARWPITLSASAVFAAGSRRILGWLELAGGAQARPQGRFEMFDDCSPSAAGHRCLGGLSAALALVLLGNWGTVRMIWHGLQRLAPCKSHLRKPALLPA
jgi:hypothetical protein